MRGKEKKYTELEENKLEFNSKKFADRITFNDSRWYTMNGRKFQPSVTHKLSYLPKGERFYSWLRELGLNSEIVVQQAGKEGTRVHDGIEQLLHGNVLNWDDKEFNFREWKMIVRAYDFIQTWKPDPILIEHQFYSNKYKCGGSADLVADIDGETWMLDWKSSKQINIAYFLQLWVYSQMYEESFGKKIDRMGVVHLKTSHRGRAYEKSGIMQGAGWRVVEVPKDTWSKLGKVWRALDVIWEQFAEVKKPHNVVYPSKLSLGKIDANTRKLLDRNGIETGKKFK